MSTTPSDESNSSLPSASEAPQRPSPPEPEPSQTPGEPPEQLEIKDRVGFLIDLWKKSVDVQQHFNDIEWRIRGLALTVATFAFGAAGVAAKDGTKLGPLSLGSAVILLGLILWYAFYFVDRVWYHALLKASVDQGAVIEQEIERYIPEAQLTSAISRGSANAKLGCLTIVLQVVLSFRISTKMDSTRKLVWFYKVGAIAFLIGAVALQLGTMYRPSPSAPQPIVVRVEDDSGSRLRGASPHASSSSPALPIQ